MSYIRRISYVRKVSYIRVTHHSGHPRGVWNHRDVAGEDDLVARLGHLADLVPADHVDAARHGARGDLVRILLDPQSLPIHEDALLEKLAEARAVTFTILTHFRL